MCIVCRRAVLYIPHSLSYSLTHWRTGRALKLTQSLQHKFRATRAVISAVAMLTQSKAQSKVNISSSISSSSVGQIKSNQISAADGAGQFIQSESLKIRSSHFFFFFFFFFFTISVLRPDHKKAHWLVKCKYPLHCLPIITSSTQKRPQKMCVCVHTSMRMMISTADTHTDTCLRSTGAPASLQAVN